MTELVIYMVLKSRYKLKNGGFNMKGKVLRRYVAETKERIVKAVKYACEGRCALLSIKESETTNSMYFTIGNGRAHTTFRISDHSTRQKIKSFTVSKNTRMDAVVRFVVSTINRLERSSLYRILDSLSANFAVA
jgi:hypothetical protein